MRAQLKKEHEERLHKCSLLEENPQGRVANEAEVEQVAAMLNRRMEEVILDPRGRSWYKMFVRLDFDGSGKITFGELQDMVRNELRMSSRQFSDELLLAIWRALDEDKSGLITCGEFGQFMRKGLKRRDNSKVSEHLAAAAQQRKARADEMREQKKTLQQERNLHFSLELDKKRGMASNRHDESWGFSSTSSASQQPWRSPRALLFSEDFTK